jgi:hypothetical protein
MAAPASLSNRENSPVLGKFAARPDDSGAGGAVPCLLGPAIACFSEPELCKINHLVLMFFRLSRAHGALPREGSAGLLARHIGSG